jgi:hypothetical protein
MSRQPLDYFAADRKPSLTGTVVDFAILLGCVIFVNAVVLVLQWRARDIDRSAYFILFGPANAAVAVLALAFTPLVTRWNHGVSAKAHVTLSLLVPVAAIVFWAVLFGGNAP